MSGLTRITKPAEKRNFLVYDMEWYPGRSRLDSRDPIFLSEEGENRGLRLAGIYDGERYSSYTNIDAFLDALFTRDNDEKWMYAHYGGMADATFVLEAICRRVSDNFHVEASFSGSSAIIINVKKGPYTFHLIDSFWLLRDRLSKLGEAVGLKKLGEDYKCSNFPNCGHIDALEEHYLEEGDEPPSLCVFYAPMGELKTYNERDCLILYKAIAQFEDLLLQLGGQLQMTIASCAMALFRRRYLGADIKTDPVINLYARRAYTSSRVEVYQSGCPSEGYIAALARRGIAPCPRRCYSVLLDVPEGEWANYECCPRCWDYFLKARASYLDFNSSFPYSMTFDNPGSPKKNGYRDGALPRRRDAMYLADIEVSVPPMYLPPLPYRHKNRVFFPVGKWRSWFSNIDLDLLLERGGRIEKVHSSIEFQKQSFLRDYALTIYELRKKATSSYEKLILKYLLNSLYGKFGESTEKQSMLLNPIDTNCPHKTKHRCEEFPNCEHGREGLECNLCMQPLPFAGGFIVTNEVSLPHEWVPISVLITARSRMNLERQLHLAQRDIYYCDTDSIITTETLPTDDKKLGALKKEKEVVEGRFVACKVYVTRDGEGHREVKAKGFSRMNYRKFLDVEAGNSIPLARMTRIRELARKGNIRPQEAIVEKRLVQNCLPKRCMLPGGQTRPWTIEEIDHDQAIDGVSMPMPSWE